jgi:hypothetical protein
MDEMDGSRAWLLYPCTPVSVRAQHRPAQEKAAEPALYDRNGGQPHAAEEKPLRVYSSTLVNVTTKLKSVSAETTVPLAVQRAV